MKDSNAESVIIPIKAADYERFREIAKQFGVLYATAKHENKETGVLHIISNVNYSAQLNAVMEAMDYAVPEVKSEENAIKKPPPLKFKETKTINFSAVPLLLASSNAHSNSARSGVRRRPTPHDLAPTGRSLHGRSREAYSLHRMTVLNFSLHTG